MFLSSVSQQWFVNEYSFTCRGGCARGFMLVAANSCKCRMVSAPTQTQSLTSPHLGHQRQVMREVSENQGIVLRAVIVNVVDTADRTRVHMSQ